MLFRKITGKRVGIIYKITNKITGKIYIGQTIKRLGQRWALHKNSTRRCPLNSSMKKHGFDNFSIEVLVNVLDSEDLNSIEAEYIREYDCIYPNGYNLLSSGNISNANHGRAPWNKGLKATDEQRRKLSEAHLGQKAWNAGLSDIYSEKTKRKMSLAKKGRRISPQTEFKKSQPSEFKGRKHTPEALTLISENGNRIAIVCVETGVVYPSISEAAESLGIAKSHLRRCVISGKPVRMLGMTFRFK